MSIIEYLSVIFLYLIASLIKKYVISTELAERLKNMESNLDKSFRVEHQKGTIKGLA